MNVIFYIATLAAIAFQSPQKLIVWNKTSHDFGKVWQGDTLITEFKYYNRSDTSFQIENVVSSCGCTTGKWSKTPIQPGDSGVIEVQFLTEGKRKKHEKVIAVYTSLGLFELGILADIQIR